MTFGWQAQFTHEFMRGGWRLHLWRDRPEGQVELLSGELVGQLVDPSVYSMEPGGIWLPGDAYKAIADAFPPASHPSEVRRLEEALTLERARVDRALASLGQ